MTPADTDNYSIPSKPVEWIVTWDDDCHDYIIPYLRKADWEKWLHDEAYEYEDIPDWATPIDGGNVIFTSWRLE